MQHQKILTMKKTVITILSCISGFSFIAQTLNQSTHAPAIGDVYVFQYADPTTLPANLGNPGPGNTFNFASLTVYPPTYTAQGISVASTGSASTYPSANVAVKTGTDNAFYNSQSNKLEFYGGNFTFGGYPVTLNFSTPAVLGVYPMGLGTTNTNTVAGTINLSGNNGNFVGTVSFTANATGTLTVPGGQTYANVIRVQTNQLMTFTITFVQGTITVDQYDYYAPSYSNFPNPNNNWPVLTIQNSTVVSTVGGTSVQSTVTINSNYQTLSNEANHFTFNNSHVSLFPNPAKDFVTIMADKIKNIEIIDISGKKILETNKNTIDLTSFQSGLYFIRVETDSQSIIEKLIVE